MYAEEDTYIHYLIIQCWPGDPGRRLPLSHVDSKLGQVRRRIHACMRRRIHTYTT